jgi:hypothetical protein
MWLDVGRDRPCFLVRMIKEIEQNLIKKLEITSK